MAKEMSQEHKDSMAYGRLLKKQAKELYIEKHDSINWIAYNKLVDMIVILQESLIALQNREVSIKKEEKKEEKKEAIIEDVMSDLSWGVEAPAENETWPRTKKVDAAWYTDKWKDMVEITLVYSTISKKVPSKMWLSWELEKGTAGKPVRYVELEEAEARVNELKSSWVVARINRWLKETIPKHMKDKALIMWYNNGFLVLSQDKLKQIWLM